MLGVKDFGRVPMAWSIRPVFRGDPVLCDGGKSPGKGSARVRAGIRTCKAVRRIVCCVQSSLPCVSMWGRKNRCSDICGHNILHHCFRKPSLQKRLRLWNILSWKTPRLSERGRQGIAVRSKWQSGTHYHGNTWADGSNGNGLCGNGRFCPVKNNPT